MSFPWTFTQNTAPPKTPREIMLERLRNGVPAELATRAAGVRLEDVREDPEFDKAVAEGEIMLFERARDSGVTGAVRAAMRQEAKTWQPKAEGQPGMTLEDYLRD
jgi:hypothetical protein